MKGQWTKLLVVTVAFLLIAGACAAPPPPMPTPVPPTATPPTATPIPLAPDGVDVAQAWMEAISAGDVDAALVLVSNNVKFRFGDEGGTGPAMMGGHLNWWAGIDTKYHILDCQAEGERALCDTTIVDGCIAASGYSDGLPMKIEFVVGSDGKISEITAPTFGEQWDAYWKQVGSAQAWFQAYRAEEFAKNDWSRAFGPTMVRLCNEWAAAMKTQPAATEAAAQAWVAALNSGDVDAALAFFKGETMFKFWNDTSQGEEQMRAMFDWLVGKETLYQITNCEWQGTGVTCDVTAVDGCIAASEVPGGVHGKLTFNSHEDGTLKSVVGVLLVAERKAYQTWLDAERAWAAAERADELAQAEGYSKPAGAMAVKLCKEYGESLKATPAATPMSSTPAPSSDLEKLAKSFADAFNQRDLDTALALFVDEGLNFMWDGGKTDSKQTGRDWLEQLIARGTQLTITDCAPKGKALGCTLLARDDCWTKAISGLDAWQYDVTLNARDGKI